MLGPAVGPGNIERIFLDAKPISNRKVHDLTRVDDIIADISNSTVEVRASEIPCLLQG